MLRVRLPQPACLDNGLAFVAFFFPLSLHQGHTARALTPPVALIRSMIYNPSCPALSRTALEIAPRLQAALLPIGCTIDNKTKHTHTRAPLPGDPPDTWTRTVAQTLVVLERIRIY